METGSLKSRGNFELRLIKGLLEDSCIFHSIPLHSVKKDLETLRRRVKKESLTFLTKTLPLLGKALDQGLLSGTFQRPSNFKGAKLPLLFSGLFRKVFCQESGVLLDKVNTEAIKELRQLCFMFYKYDLGYTKDLELAYIRDFIKVDRGINPPTFTPEHMSTIFYAKEVLHEILKDFDLTTLKPKNGPGAVANGLKPWQRMAPTSFYADLDTIFPYHIHFYYNDKHLFDHFERFWALDHENYGTAELLAVPKDSRGPRLISKGQSEFQTAQQALKNILVPWIERHPLCRGQINFTDQSINAALALESSMTLEFGTLDLEKASDLMALWLVEDLYEEEPEFLRFLLNSREAVTSTPLGDVTLKKFAPMGSALTFPIQALTYYCLIVGDMVARGTRLGTAAKLVWVYGDDIIVPTESVPATIATLESMGLKVNAGKSCYTGKFRESCGMDAYDGVDVTPVKLKKPHVDDPDLQTKLSWIAACNNLFARGFWRASDVIRKWADRSFFREPLPLTTAESPVIGWETCNPLHILWAQRSKAGWCLDHFGLAWEGFTLVSVSKERSLSGWEKLLRRQWYNADEKPHLYLRNREARALSVSGFVDHVDALGSVFSASRFTERNAVKLKRCHGLWT